VKSLANSDKGSFYQQQELIDKEQELSESKQDQTLSASSKKIVIVMKPHCTHLYYELSFVKTVGNRVPKCDVTKKLFSDFFDLNDKLKNNNNTENLTK